MNVDACLARYEWDARAGRMLAWASRMGWATVGMGACIMTAAAMDARGVALRLLAGAVVTLVTAGLFFGTGVLCVLKAARYKRLQDMSGEEGDSGSLE